MIAFTKCCCCSTRAAVVAVAVAVAVAVVVVVVVVVSISCCTILVHFIAASTYDTELIFFMVLVPFNIAGGRPRARGC